MSATARIDPQRQRGVLALMGVDVYAPRVRVPAPARPVLLGDAADPLVAAIASALGLDAGSVRAPSAPVSKPAVAIVFGAGGADAVHLPSLERLRAEGAAKREAWRALRRWVTRS